MKTFLKVLLVFAIAALVIHFWPVAAVPLALGGLVALLFGIVFAGGVAVVGALLITVLCALIGVLFALAAASSPIWLPVLAIVGLVALLRRHSRTTA